MKNFAAAILSVLVLLPVANAGNHEPDPLTLRVNDATAPPGGLVAVVLRTYAARPIRQGQICMFVRLFREKSVSTRVDAMATLSSTSMRIPAAGPFEALEGALVFSDANDAVEQIQFLPADVGQPTMLEFDSASATVNASDGPLLVLYYRLRSDLIPGERYELSVDLANTVFVDDQGLPVPLETREGQLTIRAATDPVSASASAEAPDEFDTVILSLQTEEAIAISSGQIGLRYSRLLLPGTPKILIDPRYGAGQWNLVHIRGLSVVQFTSADHSLNTVPGDIVSLSLELNPAAAAGEDRNVWLDPAYTYLYDAEGNALTLVLEGDVIPD